MGVNTPSFGTDNPSYAAFFLFITDILVTSYTNTQHRYRQVNAPLSRLLLADIGRVNSPFVTSCLVVMDMGSG